MGAADLCWLGSCREERLLQVQPRSRTLLIQLPLLPNDCLRVFLAAHKLQEKLFAAEHTVAFVQTSGNGEVMAQCGCGGLHSPFLSQCISKLLRGAVGDPLSDAELLLTCSCLCAVCGLL